MSIEVMKSYFPRFTEAFFLTIRIGWMGVILAFVIGLITAFTVQWKIPLFAKLAGVYIEIFRNTPLLVQLFFIYFGLPKIGIRIPAQIVGAVGIGLLGGSYMAEGFRSGLESVSKAQTESAIALGMTRFQVFQYVVLPEAFALSVPAILANVIFLLKETSVFSAISLMDLMFTAKDLIGLYYNTAESLFLLVLFYLVMLLPVSLLGGVVEQKVRVRMLGD